MTVFILTIVRSYQYRRDFRPLERWSGTLSLAELIVRDGASDLICALLRLTKVCRRDVFWVCIRNLLLNKLLIVLCNSVMGLVELANVFTLYVRALIVSYADFVH